MEAQFSNFEGRVDVHEIASRKGWFIMHGYSFADSDFNVFLPEKTLAAECSHRESLPR